MVNTTSLTSDNRPSKTLKAADFMSVETNIKNHFESLAGNMANEDNAVNSVAASGTGDAVVSDVTGRSKEYKHLIDYGLDGKVANRLDEIFKTGKTKARRHILGRDTGGDVKYYLSGINIRPLSLGKCPEKLFTMFLYFLKENYFIQI